MFLDLWRIRCSWKRRGGIYNADTKGNSAVSNQIGTPARAITYTRCSLFLGPIGGFFETVTSILGFVMMVTSVFCVITKIMDVSVFVEMFLAGAAFEAIPILLVKLGEKGMLGLMDLLGRV